MLYFYIKNTNELVTTLTLNDIKWLVKFHIIKKGTTGLLEDDGVESLPFFDDYDLTYNDAILMNTFAKNKIDELRMSQRFKSDALDKYIKILNNIIENNLTLSVICS